MTSVNIGRRRLIYPTMQEGTGQWSTVVLCDFHSILQKRIFEVGNLSCHKDSQVVYVIALYWWVPVFSREQFVVHTDLERMWNMLPTPPILLREREKERWQWRCAGPGRHISQRTYWSQCASAGIHISSEISEWHFRLLCIELSWCSREYTYFTGW